MDEAHHLKNRASVSWKFVNALQKKYILLLTATPVQNSLDELYNLITILKPGQLKTPREFQRQFVVHGDPRLPKNRGKLRELLADVMVRHARGQVGLQLPPRRAHVVRLALGPDERALYDDVSAFVRAQIKPAGRIARANGERRGADEAPALSTAHRFTLQTLQREIGSSPLAARPTLLSWPSRTRCSRTAPSCWRWPTAPRASAPGPKPPRWRSSCCLCQAAPGGATRARSSSLPTFASRSTCWPSGCAGWGWIL